MTSCQLTQSEWRKYAPVNYAIIGSYDSLFDGKLRVLFEPMLAYYQLDYWGILVIFIR